MKKIGLKRILLITALVVVSIVILPTLGVQAKKKVKLNKTKATIYRGRTIKLKVKNNKKKVKWKSSNKKIATVTKKGVVKAKNVGKATITATVRKKKYKCKITVKHFYKFDYWIDDGEIYISDYIGSNIGDLVIPDKVEGKKVVAIEPAAFSGCTSLKSIKLPEGICYIGENAFDGCTLLKSITIPKEVSEISAETFNNCTSLTSVTLPEGLGSIGMWAFGKCGSLKSIKIPKGVKTIGASAFYECSSMTSVTLPNELTDIGDWAFGRCSSLPKINIPQNVKNTVTI